MQPYQLGQFHYDECFMGSGGMWKNRQVDRHIGILMPQPKSLQNNTLQPIPPQP